MSTYCCAEAEALVEAGLYAGGFGLGYAVAVAGCCVFFFYAGDLGDVGWLLVEIGGGLV